MQHFHLTTRPTDFLNASTVFTQGELLQGNVFVGAHTDLLEHVVRALGVPLEARWKAELEAEGMATVPHPDFSAWVRPREVIAHASPEDPRWEPWLARLRDVSRALECAAYVTMSDGAYVLATYVPQLDVWLVREGFAYTLDTPTDSVGFGRRD